MSENDIAEVVERLAKAANALETVTNAQTQQKEVLAAISELLKPMQPKGAA